MKRNPEQVLDQEVSNWEASSRRQSFTVPPGTYKADLQGMTFDVVTTQNGDGVVAGFTFLSVSPVEGLILKVNRFLTSKNDREEHYGIGQLLDEVDMLHAILGWKPVDRSQLTSDKPGNGKRVRVALEKVFEEKRELKGVTIVAEKPGKSKTSGRTYQTISIGLDANVDGEEVAEKIFKEGDEVSYDGKTWKVIAVDEDTSIATIKLGRKEAEVSFDELEKAE